MSTDVKTAAEAAAKESAAPADEIKNLKSEMNRKIDNLNDTNKQLLAQLNNMAKNIVPPKKPETPQQKKSFYEDEDGYMANVKEEVKKEIRSEITQANAVQAKQATVIASLVKDFPELNDGESELSKKAIEVFNAMPDDEKSSPVAYKAAVREAANELDIKPKSKRKAENDDDSFQMGGSRNTGPREQGKKRVDPRTSLFAEALGVDMKKVEARIQKRKSFTSWE